MTQLQDAVWRQDMEAEWKEVISRNRPELCKMIDTEGDFIDHLEGLKVFNNRTCQSFKSKTGRYSQVSAILTALSKRPFEDFVKFCQSLEKSNQGHIISDYLNRQNPQATVATTTDPVVMPTNLTRSDARPEHVDAMSNNPLSNIWRDLIRDNYPALVNDIDPDHGLISYLVGKKVIVEWMQDMFTTKQGRSNRAAAILDHLLLKRPFEDFLKFCDALSETNQKHVVEKYLSCSRLNVDQSDVHMRGTRSHTIDSRKEMSELLSKYDNLSNLDWKATFVETRSSLVDNIDASNDFINLLLGLGIFNAISFEACQEKEDFFQRVEFILDYMRRRPDEDFVRFCVALAKNNQDHVIEFLLQHRIEKLPQDSLSPQLQPSKGGRVEKPLTQIRHPVEANEPMNKPQTEIHQQDEKRFNVPHHGQQHGLGTQTELHQQLEKGLDIQHLPQQPIEVNPSQRVICQPQDDAWGEPHQSILIPSSSGNAVPMHELMIWGNINEPAVQLTEDNDRGPLEILNVSVTPCSGDFYKTLHSRAYPMCRRRRGKCVILNNKIVAGMSQRNGTEVDGQLLCELFKKLHFQVELLDNITAADIKRKMTSISKDEMLHHDQCFVLFVLSHGQAIKTPAGMVDCIYGSDGEPVAANEILEPLIDVNCPQLRNKPKLIFFQACRGDYYQDQTQTDAPPVFRDFLIGYPTQRDYRSFRNTAFGAWYINAIVQVFMQRACDTSVADMMNMVTGKVAAWTTNTDNPESHQKGQIATYSSHLTKLLYFFPGIVAENDR